ncbi:MM3350-like domain-containing protein [Tribonema minus]|uniref:MM3350-like domain-containing protein n=1 Tax=Tribonema minus TaxID=303371 RepID=A0A836CMN3_9STRA|nr:MM3350-like domain-containing protein [Tribonema minus]
MAEVHPRDDLGGLPRELWENPDTFVPDPSRFKYFLDDWGIEWMPPDEAIGGMLPPALMRQMTAQSLYGRPPQKLRKPEEQFVRRLLKRKSRAIVAAREGAEAAERPRRDLVFKVTLYDGDGEAEGLPALHRTLRVSGGILLATFQDRVLGPAMGWVRHYHGYKFTDPTDGACIGPINSGAIDMMHIHSHGVLFMDDKKAGQIMYYTYDLGDLFQHVIEVLEVVPVKDSTGKSELLEGAMACPPEDSNGCDGMGCRAYFKLLRSMQRVYDCEATEAEEDAVMENLATAGTALNIKCAEYDPFRFNLKKARRRMAQAIAGSASPDTGNKVFVHSFSGCPCCNAEATCAPDGLVMSESVARDGVRDRRRAAVCAACGGVAGLKQCSACKVVRYCSAACQTGDWRAHKADCKRWQAERAADAK